MLGMGRKIPSLTGSSAAGHPRVPSQGVHCASKDVHVMIEEDMSIGSTDSSNGALCMAVDELEDVDDGEQDINIAELMNGEADATQADAVQDPMIGCKAIVEKAKLDENHEFAWIFKMPIEDWIVKYPNYPDFVSNPIDLSKIDGKLQDNVYTGPQEFYNDMMLMIENCLTFSPDGRTWGHKRGNRMKEFFVKEWNELNGIEPVIVPEEHTDQTTEVNGEEAVHATEDIEVPIVRVRRLRGR